MNLVIIRFLPEGSVNAYSVISYVVAFAYAVFIGVSEGMQPLFGQSYGDKNVDDLHYFKRWGMIVSLLAPPCATAHGPPAPSLPYASKHGNGQGRQCGNCGEQRDPAQKGFDMLFRILIVFLFR